MPVAFDTGSLFTDVVIGLADIALYRLNSEGELAETAETKTAKKSSITNRELAESDGRYVSTDFVFRWEGQPGDEPPIGSHIGTTPFVILESWANAQLNRIRVVVRDMNIFGGLDSFCHILKTDVERGTGGAGKYEWPVYKAGQRVRIQRQAADAGIVDGRRAATETALAYFANQEELDGRFRIRELDKHGKAVSPDWRVTGYTGPDRIGELTVVGLERDV